MSWSPLCTDPSSQRCVSTSHLIELRTGRGRTATDSLYKWFIWICKMTWKVYTIQTFRDSKHCLTFSSEGKVACYSLRKCCSLQIQTQSRHSKNEYFYNPKSQIMLPPWALICTRNAILCLLTLNLTKEKKTPLKHVSNEKRNIKKPLSGWIIKRPVVSQHVSVIRSSSELQTTQCGPIYGDSSQ